MIGTEGAIVIDIIPIATPSPNSHRKRNRKIRLSVLTPGKPITRKIVGNQRIIAIKVMISHGIERAKSSRTKIPRNPRIKPP
jgi:hypothetical protein